MEYCGVSRLSRRRGLGQAELRWGAGTVRLGMNAELVLNRRILAGADRDSRFAPGIARNQAAAAQETTQDVRLEQVVELARAAAR